MTQSLSIVLPVHDAQNSLRQTTESILEIVPEMTDDFEILVVDDASTDMTEEVARDLACQYPQLRVIRHREACGVKQAAQTGVEQCRGDVIFIKDDPGPVRVSDLRSLWKMREDEQLVMARSEPAPAAPVEPKPLDPALIARLMSWGAALEESPADASKGRIQMIRRRALQQMQTGDEPQAETVETARANERPRADTVSTSEQIRRRMPPRPTKPANIFDW